MLKLIFNTCLSLIIGLPFMVFSSNIHDIKTNEGDFMTQQSSITIEILKGDEVLPHLKRLVEIRFWFYRDYPYLYDGSIEDEENYLGMYGNSENTLLALAKRGDEVVGAVIGHPLPESLEENKEAFQNIDISREDLFYLGDNMVISELKIGNLREQMYYEFENAVKSLNKYKGIVVCEVERDENDPKKIINDNFYEFSWSALGFIREPEQIVNFSWKEIGDTKNSIHHMIFWRKSL